MSKRLFVAAEIPENIIDDIIQIRDEVYGESSNIKWEKKGKLHLTLKFLGDTKLEIISSIEQKLDNLINNYHSFDTQIKKFGMFKRNGNPSILMLELFIDKKMFELQKEIENELESLGFKKENRKFKPHITLLRIKGKEDFEKLNSFLDCEFEKNNFRINKISLMESELKPTGSVYKTIKSFELN